MGWPFDEIADAVDEVASVAVDVATGDWQGVAATVVDQVGEWTGIDELEQVASVVESASWGNIATAAANQLGEAIGGDLGAAISSAGQLAGAAAAGDWGAVVNGAVQIVGSDLPPEVAQLATAAATGGVDGAVDWAQNHAMDLAGQVAGDAFGADAANLMGQVATAYATGGSDAVLQMGAQTLDGIVPGAGGLASQVLSGASPDDVMEGLLDQGRSQLLTIGQQAISSTGLGDEATAAMAALNPVTGAPGPGATTGIGTDDLDGPTGVMTARAPAATDTGIGDELDTPDLVGGVATSTPANSVAGDAFDDAPGLGDDTGFDDAPDPTAAVMPDAEPEPDLPPSIQQADDVGDQAMSDVGDMFDDL